MVEQPVNDSCLLIEHIRDKKLLLALDQERNNSGEVTTENWVEWLFFSLYENKELIEEKSFVAFFFLDVSTHLDERGVLGFLERCFSDGVLVAPGASSGCDYSQWIRLCYTSIPPERALAAISIVARHLS